MFRLDSFSYAQIMTFKHELKYIIKNSHLLLVKMRCDSDDEREKADSPTKSVCCVEISGSMQRHCITTSWRGREPEREGWERKQEQPAGQTSMDPLGTTVASWSHTLHWTIVFVLDLWTSRSNLCTVAYV